MIKKNRGRKSRVKAPLLSHQLALLITYFFLLDNSSLITIQLSLKSLADGKKLQQAVLIIYF
jgi:hypothetical protein